MARFKAGKHKKKKFYTISVTSNYSSDKTKFYRSRFNTLKVCVTLATIVTILAVVVTYFGTKHILEMEQKIIEFRSLISEQEETIDQLSTDKTELLSENEILSSAIAIQRKEAEEAELIKGERTTPNQFPVTGTAVLGEWDKDAKDYVPMALFVMSEESDVVAAADGTVLYIREDSVYGNSVTIDHGNGYVTIYKNQAAPKVAEGDQVLRGSIIYVGFAIEPSKDDEDKEPEQNLLGYQITLDGIYLDPLDVIEING